MWWFRGEALGARMVPKEWERRATLGIGVLLLFLATLTIAASLLQLAQQSHPSTTLPGLIISELSLSFMFFL